MARIDPNEKITIGEVSVAKAVLTNASKELVGCYPAEIECALSKAETALKILEKLNWYVVNKALKDVAAVRTYDMTRVDLYNHLQDVLYYINHEFEIGDEEVTVQDEVKAEAVDELQRYREVLTYISEHAEVIGELACMLGDTCIDNVLAAIYKAQK